MTPDEPNTAPQAEQHPADALPQSAGAVPLSEQIKAVQRELMLRQIVYPRLLANGKLTAAKAEREMRAMQAVLETLQRVARLGGVLAKWKETSAADGKPAGDQAP